MEKDNVNNPVHYCHSSIECIDAMQAAFGTEALKSFCIGNAFKYIWRMNYKGSTKEDVEKAIWYLKKWIEIVDM